MYITVLDYTISLLFESFINRLDMVCSGVFAVSMIYKSSKAYCFKCKRDVRLVMA